MPSLKRDKGIVYMDRPLTQKQKNFARLIFQGSNQRDAYIKAYNTTYAVSTVDVNASLLRSKHKVKAYLDALNKRAESPIVLTKQQRMERLSFIASEENEGKFGFQRQPNISAIAEINKMDGAYPPERLAVLGDILVEVVYIDRDKAKNKNQDTITNSSSKAA